MAAGLSNKITNVIGTPLPNFVRAQFKIRAEKTSLDNRDDTNLVYLANKTGWIRVASSVDLVIDTDIDYFRSLLSTSDNQINEVLKLQDQQSLAEQFILYGGTSKYRKTNNGFSYDLRYGLDNNGAYGILGPNEVREYGYKPMPGITSAKITTQGRLGSVRSADISFKVWDKYQLDIIDALYLKLGFSMFIEWGNTTFYNATNNKLESGEDYAIDVFDKKLIQDKDTVRTRIYRNIVNSEGNYDAMLGIVTNFNYSFSQDGGYDCSIKVLSLGVLADSMKINKIQQLPDIAKEQVSTIFNQLQSLEKRSAAAKEAEKQAELDARLAANNPPGQVTVRDYSSFVQQFITSPTDRTKQEFVINQSSIGSQGGNNYLAGLKTTEELYLALQKSTAYINYLKDGSKKYSATIKKLPKIDNINSWWNRIEVTRGTNSTYDFSLAGNIDLLVTNNRQIPDKIDKEEEKTFLLTSGSKDASVASTFNNTGISYILNQRPYKYNVVFSLKGTRSGANGDGPIDVSNSPIPTQISNIKTITEKIKTKLTANSISDLVIENDDSKIGDETVYPIKYVNDRLTIRLKTFVQFEGLEDPKQQGGGTVAQQGVKVKVTYTFPVWIIINDLDLITSIKPLSDTLNGSATGEDASQPSGTTATPITVADVQKSEAMKYKSAIEIMLRTIQLKHISNIVPNVKIGTGGSYILEDVQKINLCDDTYLNSFTKPLFSSGLFSDFFGDLVNGNIKNINSSAISNTSPQELLKVESKYGFNYNFMKDPQGFLQLLENQKIKAPNTPKLIDELAVDYKSMMNTYLVPYNVQNTLGEGLNIPAYPVYVTFGFFLMALNHMCVLYNQQGAKGTQIKPLVYIDYNNKTNFCLANELVMSTNPLAFLLPFEGTRNSYAKLFDNVLTSGSFVITPSSGSAQELFDPENDKQNIISGKLSPKYRYTNEADATSAYRGNIMNIFVNIDYLLNTIDGFVKEDDENTVYLKPLLEKIVTDMNKSMGNINIFRVAFNDYSDTYHIIDDQLVPTIPAEDSMRTNGNDKDGNNTVLNLYGKNSIANSLEIKTEISTRLSNMIAISSNVKIDEKYAASKDASSVGYLNAGFQDRYKKQIVDAGPSTGSDANDTTKNSAIQINETIKNFYSTDSAPLDRISQLTNYYIEKMNKIKSVEPPTRASAMIPVSVNFSTDGISGLAMGQSFTIQDELLPYSYTTRKMPYGMPSYDKKVGFVIIGVDHEISNNRWTTSVRSNMYFIKDADIYNNITLNNKNTNTEKLSTAQSTTAAAQSSSPDSANGCSRRRGELQEEIVRSTIIKNAYGGYVSGKVSFIAKLEQAYAQLKTQNITLEIGDSVRSFDFQKKSYEEYLVALDNWQKGRPWIKNGKTNPPSQKPANIAQPCSGYHVIGQAIDLSQTAVQRQDILSEGPRYKALYNAGLRRIPNEWWHWSLGEVN